MVRIPTLSETSFPVPLGFARLVDLAYNLWWSWHPEGRELWTTIDPVGWERYHNPVELLMSIDAGRWRALEQIEAVHERYAAAVAAFDRYIASPTTWYSRSGDELTGPIAYLCTEFGVNDAAPFYSGGLGILAGDHAKSASDLGLPFVAAGLLYRRGYFHQEIDLDGDQQHFYPTLDVRRLPVRPVAAPTGGQLKVTIPFPGREVYVAVWALEVGRVTLLLLDTDIPENDPADRPITHQLYVAGREMRFCQELVLGAGAARAFAALGIEPGVWHVNEGHAAMSLLERLASEVEAGATAEEARAAIRAKTIFTLHTPVPAGNEVFDSALAGAYLDPWAGRVGMSPADLLALGADNGSTAHFDLGALAIRFASFVNGVSQRHGAVVSGDWGELIGHPAAAVTNGVHPPTWLGREGAALLTQNFGREWPTRFVTDAHQVERAAHLSPEIVWAMHWTRKEALTRFARGRIRRQLARHGASPDELRSVEHMLPPDRLTLGFARRFATYKRATLMFSDRERLHAILTNPERPIQIVFAGKAHPADQHGQAFIREIVELSRSDQFRGHVYMLEDYDARVARFLVQGVDVWVNNPRPPMEASGTSGMKAAMNGALNLSVLDGWWIEGFTGKNGWAFGSADASDDWGAADHHDASTFYDILEGEVAPEFYDRDDDGLPLRWIERMQASFSSSIAEFSSHRMVMDYFRLAYAPLGSA